METPGSDEVQQRRALASKVPLAHESGSLVGRPEIAPPA
jgi:hypothetical protein